MLDLALRLGVEWACNSPSGAHVAHDWPYASTDAHLESSPQPTRARRRAPYRQIEIGYTLATFAMQSGPCPAASSAKENPATLAGLVLAKERRAGDSNPQPVSRHLISSQAAGQFAYPPNWTTPIYPATRPRAIRRALRLRPRRNLGRVGSTPRCIVPTAPAAGDLPDRRRVRRAQAPAESRRLRALRGR